MDLFITLLSLGRAGYRKLLADRKAMYQYLQQQLSLCAERHGQRLLKTKNNPISIGELREIKLGLCFYLTWLSLSYTPCLKKLCKFVFVRNLSNFHLF